MFDLLVFSPVIVGTLMIAGILIELGLGKIGFFTKGLGLTFDREKNRYELSAGPIIAVFVIGLDYDLERDALLSALSEGGPGKLVHPFYGERLVTISSPHVVHESTDAGGMAQVRFSCVDAAQRLQRDMVGPAPRERLAAAATAMLDVARAEASARMTDGVTLGVLGAIASLSAAADEAGAAIADAHATVGAALGTAVGASSEVRRLARFAPSLLSEPSRFATEVQTAIRLILGAYGTGEPTHDPLSGRPIRSTPAEPWRQAGRARAVLEAGFRLADLGHDAPAIDTSTTYGQREAARRTALHHLVRGSAIAALGQATLDLPFDSRNAAIDALTRLINALDAYVLEATDAELEVIADLRLSVTRHLLSVAATLPELTQYTVPVDAPALVIAYELYGDPRRGDELVARNRIQHPLFVRAGTVLEALRE